MTNFLSEQMLQAVEGMRKWDIYKNKIEKIQSLIWEVENQIVHLETAYEKEEADVTKLEEGKLSVLMLKMIGKYDQALEKETLEKEQAKLRLEQKRDELSGLNQNLETLQKECMPYRKCEVEYNRLYREKVKNLENSEGQGKVKYVAIQQAIKTHEANIKEIREAILAGQRVMQVLANVAKSLDKAKDWGTWDLFGGGMLSDLAKHSHLDDAKLQVQEAQRLIGAFQTELADIHITLHISIDTDGFAKFADFFFDGIFADLYMQDRISEAQRSVARALGDVKDMCTRLEGLLREEEQAIGVRQHELESLVISG